MRPARRRKQKAAVPPVCAPAREPSLRGGDSTASPTVLIESQLASSSEPVLGLYLHVAYMTFMSTYEERVGRGEVSPAVIGVLALLAQHPGMSQADLARLSGIKRATVGATIARAMASGFVRRVDSSVDARRYSLYLSSRGEQMLVKLRQRIPEHERHAAGRLSFQERLQLRSLLDKLVYG